MTTVMFTCFFINSHSKLEIIFTTNLVFLQFCNGDINYWKSSIVLKTNQKVACRFAAALTDVIHHDILHLRCTHLLAPQ